MRGRNRTRWAHGLRNVFADEWRVIRGRDPDLDATDFTEFSGPLLARGFTLVIVGLLPIVGVRLAGAQDAAVFGPLLGSFALAAVATTTIVWVLAIALAGSVVLIVYRVTPKVASAATEQAVRQSFQRIADFTSNITLIALISGLVSLAIGLPSMTSSDDQTSILEELLTAQVACLLVVLVIAFTVEAVRMSAEILGSQAPVTAWLGALVISMLAFCMSATVGPFEPIQLTRNLLDAWLPADVDGTPRAEVIADLLPHSAYVWSLVVIFGYVLVVWVATAWRTGGLARLVADIRARADS